MHIPQVLYYWRVHAASTSGGTGAKPYVIAAAQKAVADHLAATGRQGSVEAGKFPGLCHVRWTLPNPPPLVSILIPNKDHTADLEKCLHSLYARTNYDHYEVIVIENNSTDPATFDYYKTLPQRYEDCRVVRYQGPFNFSAINNFGRRKAKGEYLLLLNNDVEILSHDWLGELLAEASQPGVAASGAMLYYPDDTIQHAGVITGLGGLRGPQPQIPPAGGPAAISTVWPPCRITLPSPLPACWCGPRSMTSWAGWTKSSPSPSMMWTSACASGRPAGALSGRPTPNSITMRAKAAAPMRRTLPRRPALTPNGARLYERHGREAILHDPYYNPNLSLDYEDFRESADLRNLKNGGMPL